MIFPSPYGNRPSLSLPELESIGSVLLPSESNSPMEIYNIVAGSKVGSIPSFRFLISIENGLFSFNSP